MLAYGKTLPALALMMSLIALVLQWKHVAPIGWVMALALYFIIWWVMLFAVLPFGVRTQSDEGAVIQGTSAGAPTDARMLRVVLLTTIVASTVFSLVLIAMAFRLISLGT
jgi:predicted secreted protein